MTDKKLYTPDEHALNVLEAKASIARRRAHGTNLRAYRDAVMEVGYAYLKAHPQKAPTSWVKCDGSATCQPHATECPRCKNHVAKCDDA